MKKDTVVDAPPEQEYIITEKRLFEWVLQSKITKGEADIVRSRPYTAPTDTTGQKEPWCYPRCMLIEKARQDEREKVIDILKQRKSTIKSLYPECGTVMKELGKIRIEEIDGIIESLQKPGVK